MLEHCFMRAERTNKIKNGTARRYEYKSGVSKTELGIFHSLQSLTIENMTHCETTLCC